MSWPELERVARIFYLGLGESSLAEEGGRRATVQLKNQFSSYFRAQNQGQDLPSGARPSDADLVRICTPLLKEYWQDAIAIERDQLADLPQKTTLWFLYLRHAQHEEAIALLFSALLKMSDEEIADGLDTTVGTVRYRVGRAHRQLGSLVQIKSSSVGAP